MTITISGKTISVFLLVVVLLALGANAVWVTDRLHNGDENFYWEISNYDRSLADLEDRVDSLNSIVLRLDSISKARKATQRAKPVGTSGKPLSFR